MEINVTKIKQKQNVAGLKIRLKNERGANQCFMPQRTSTNRFMKTIKQQLVKKKSTGKRQQHCWTGEPVLYVLARSVIQIQYFGYICCTGGSGNVIVIVLEYHLLNRVKTFIMVFSLSNYLPLG